MARYHNTDLLAVKLDVNDKHDISKIYSEMARMFDAVAPAYKGKTNRTELDIKFALKSANQVIYREVKLRAPTIRPEIQAGKSESRKSVHLSDKKYMKERQAEGKRWRSQGIIARRVVTFSAPVSTYVAAVEYGRDSFLQFVKKSSKGGYVRKVGAMKAQPFLRVSQNTKAQAAYDTFAAVLAARWVNTMKAVARHQAK